MVTRTNIMLYLGALFATGCVGFYLMLWFGSDSTHLWWIGATALSSGWIFASIAFGPWRWARTAIPTGIAGAFAYAYILHHSLDALAYLFIAAWVITGGLHLWMARPPRATVS